MVNKKLVRNKKNTNINLRKIRVSRDIMKLIIRLHRAINKQRDDISHYAYHTTS